MTSRPSVLFAVTSPSSALAFLRGQLGYLRFHGFDAHVITGEDNTGLLQEMCSNEGATLHQVPIEREPNLSKDVYAFASVRQVLMRVRPGILVAGTPKMSLMALLAARTTRLPVRAIYLCHGLRFEGYSGYRRQVLAALELLLSRLAHEVVAVSPSVSAELAKIGVARSRLSVLGHGSANGVDVELYRPASPSERKRARRELDLPPDSAVISFIGRLNRDKGLSELQAIVNALTLNPNRRTPIADPPQATLPAQVRVLIAGQPEPYDKSDRETIAGLREHPAVMMTGHLPDVRLIYEASDVVVLPTRREGLPTVVLEASASGLPTIAYEATGTVDAIRHGHSGLLIPQGQQGQFVNAVADLLSNHERRLAMGTYARQYVQDKFPNVAVWNHWLQFLSKQLSNTPLRK